MKSEIPFENPILFSNIYKKNPKTKQNKNKTKQNETKQNKTNKQTSWNENALAESVGKFDMFGLFLQFSVELNPKR